VSTTGNIKEKFNLLTPGHKKLVIWAVIVSVFLVATMVGYKSTRSSGNTAPPPKEKTREISLEPDMLQKTMLREQRRELESLKKEMNAMREETKPAATEPKLNIPSAEELEHNGSRRAWPQPPGNRFASPVPPPPGGAMVPPPPPPIPPPPAPAQPAAPAEVIGAIGVLSNQAAVKDDKAAEDKGVKKKPRKVYLPPSFMEARLLTGFDASTSGDGKNNPEPVLLRIQTPAILPNDVKANLRGCFVIAEAVGRLNKERADVRLTNLSCLSQNGNAVIDTPIKGFVTDSDSKIGLSGRVVSKMGAATARAVIAGLFGGAGDAIKAGAQSQSLSPLGSTAIVDSSKLGKAAVGGGVGEAAKTLHDFYLDLAKQATPVIEVGATKQITVVITEGKEIEIKEFDRHEAL